MSIISPFFQKHHLPSTNIGKMLVAMAATMDDAQLVAWGEAMDWSEPVISLRRYERGAERLSGYPEAETGSWSLAEILVMTGSERLVELLLTRERLPENLQVHGTQLRQGAYRDVPGDIALINAAIRTGSPRILDHALSVALDQPQPSMHQWLSSDRYAPFTCLVDQTHLPPGQALSLWRVLEQYAKAITVKQWGKKTASKFTPQFRQRCLEEACRVGNASFAEAFSESYGLPITHDMWVNLLDAGNVEWALGHAASRAKWPPEEEPTRNNASDGKKQIPETMRVLQSAISQVREADKVFQKTSRHQEVVGAAMKGLGAAMEVLRGERNGSSLLSTDDAWWANHLAPALVRFDPEFASKHLNEIKLPLSVAEACAYFRKDADSKASNMKVFMRRLECGVVECETKKAGLRMREAVVSAKEGVDVAIVVAALAAWQVKDAGKWEVDRRLLVEIEAEQLHQSAPAARARTTRRL